MPTFDLQFLASAEKIGIVGGIEKAFNSYFPRIAIGRRFIPKYRYAMVYFGGQASVPAVAEDRQCQRIRVDERDLFRCKGEHAIGVV